MNRIINRPIIFGASGFIGQHFIKEVGLERCLPVSRHHHDNPAWIKADLLDSNSVNSVLKPGMVVINLAYSQQLSPDENIKMARNLVKACRAVGIAKLVHCSTAVVVGNNPSYFVDEDTACHPVTDYERVKYEIEKIMLEAANDDLSVCILRPTGVTGSNGKNLRKMLSEIRHGSQFINFIRSSIYGKRPLNLVPVNDVVKALIHLSEMRSPSTGIYICGADDDINNQYHHIESIMRSLLNKPARIKPIMLPAFILNMLLRLNRSGSGRTAKRFYSTQKLLSSGFKRTTTISDAIKEFILSELAGDQKL